MFAKTNLKKGFSAIELIVYMAIFVVSAIFLISILTAVTRVQTRQISSREVDEQILFINRTIEQAIKESSLIDIPAGVPMSMLVLRTSLSSTDPVRVYASGTVLYLDQGGVTYALTESRTVLQDFTVTKYDNPGAAALVEISVSLGYNIAKPGGAVVRSFKTAFNRVSAAEFDSSVYPANDNALDLGISLKKWRDGYFAGNLDVSGYLGVGASPSPSARIKSGGDIGFSNSGSGLILMSPGGTCYRLTIANGGSFSTTTAACP